ILSLSIFAMAIASVRAQAPSPAATASDVASLREEVTALSETVKALQQQVKEQQVALEKANLAGLPQQPDVPAATGSTSASPSPPPTLFPATDSSVTTSASANSAPAVNANGTAFPTTDDAVVPASASTMPTLSTATPTTDASVVTTTSGGLTGPIGISAAGGKTYMNISFDGQFALAGSTEPKLYNLEVGDHDPQQRGFNARNLELALDGAVDPYFEGFANIVFKLDNDNRTEVEAEEAFLQTTSLPWGVQVKAGQFFAPFGRINPTHPHTWDFADDPLVHGLLLGSDGLRGVGAQVSWTLPLPWYSQLLLAVQNGRGNTGFSFRNPGDDGTFFERTTVDREMRGLYDFVWVPRLENSFNLSDTQTVLIGASGAFGSNDTGPNARTQIYGGDLLYKWKSARAEGGFPFVKWQTEAMYRRFEAGRGLDNTFPVAETFHDWGLYSQVLWGFKKGWVAGVRGDHVEMTDSHFTDDPTRQPRTRASADLTWYPTEFSKLRLQYNHDWLESDYFFPSRNADSVFLQFEFILGAHGAHKF
ncbi:MAG: hypothetical protein M3R59_07355, partial [Verrucomicrobiota bacterium]|nr:hypothetical protein [Verrucomicrobiota bacterium]